ncbi:uncharacterized protein LOC144746039 [Ciona intestinalis]
MDLSNFLLVMVVLFLQQTSVNCGALTRSDFVNKLMRERRSVSEQSVQVNEELEAVVYTLNRPAGGTRSTPGSLRELFAQFRKTGTSFKAPVIQTTGEVRTTSSSNETEATGNPETSNSPDVEAEIQSEENQHDVTISSSVDETAPGVDPNDVEEIARKRHYAAKDGFAKIIDINQRVGVTGIEEGDMRKSLVS